MLTIRELDDDLKRHGAHYELIRQDEPIISTQDAAKYYDVKYAAPALVVQSDQGLMLLVASARRGRLDLKQIGAEIGFSKLKLADRKKVEAGTGYSVGAIPLIGIELPCIFDDTLLEYEFIYGGSGDAYYTLKIAPEDVKRLNQIVFSFE